MKAPAHAKSRLRATVRGQIPVPDATALATAFLRDVIDASAGAIRVGRVLVISPDPIVEKVVAESDCGFIPEDPPPDGTAISGINRAIVQAVAQVRASHPTASVVALTGDLAALTSDSLDAAFALSESYEAACFVADRHGTGTTALMLPRGFWTQPQFGMGSAAAHVAAGVTDISREVGLDLRSDVDTAADLDDAIELGVGPHTARLLG
jgi:2-phospho-L-lactate guanylyltransferase